MENDCIDDHAADVADCVVSHTWDSGFAEIDVADAGHSVNDPSDHRPTHADIEVPDAWDSLPHDPAYVRLFDPDGVSAGPLSGPKPRLQPLMDGRRLNRVVKSCRQRPTMQVFRHPQSAESRARYALDAEARACYEAGHDLPYPPGLDGDLLYQKAS